MARTAILSPWDLFDEDNRRFRKVLITVVVAFVILGIIVSRINVPELDRQQKEAVPPRLATVLLEKRQKPPSPPPKKIKEQPKPKPDQPKKEVEKAPEVPKKDQPPVKPEVTKKQEQIRKKVAKVGLLALTSELMSLNEAPVLKRISQKNKSLVKTAKSTSNRPKLATTDKVSKTSDGIDTSKLTNKTASTQLAQRETTLIKMTTVEASGDDRRSDDPRVVARTIEELQFSIQRHKGRFDILYNRALRKNPTLRGTVLFELTIAPSGKVTKCRILSSELNSATLEKKLRIKMKAIDFGAKDVPIVVVEYPLVFLPA